MQKRGTEMSEIEIEGCILVVGLEECRRVCTPVEVDEKRVDH